MSTEIVAAIDIDSSVHADEMSKKAPAELIASIIDKHTTLKWLPGAPKEPGNYFIDHSCDGEVRIDVTTLDAMDFKLCKIWYASVGSGCCAVRCTSIIRHCPIPLPQD